MFSVKHCVSGIGAGLFLAALAASAPASNTTPTSQPAGCNGCKMTRVQVADTTAKGRVLGYHSVEKMTCPSCKDAVQNFISTGKFQHSCSACGDNSAGCDTHHS